MIATINQLRHTDRGQRQLSACLSKRIETVQVLIKQARRIYRKLPKDIKHHHVLQKIKDHVISRMSHDQIYDQDYYHKVDEWALVSAGPMATSIKRDFEPSTVIDVGCGTGALLEALKKRTISVKGLEYSQDGIQRCIARGLDVVKFDIETDHATSLGQYDLTVSFEVAEHLHESVSDRYVDLLSSLSNTVVMTAAPPGQLGTDHVNLQPKSYWIEKFEERGFAFDEATTSSWASEWARTGSVEGFYHRNLLVFQKTT